MRTFLACVLAILVGAGAALSLVGYRLDQTLHTPEPLQRIAGPNGAGYELRRAVPDAVAQSVVDSLGEDLPTVAQELVHRAARSVTNQVIYDERFPQAWEDSLEQTRTGWVEQLGEVRAQAEAGEPIAEDAGQLRWHLGPVAHLTATILAEQVDEALTRVPFSSVVPELADQVAEASIELSLHTDVPPVEYVSATRMAQVAHWTQHWQWLAGGSAVVLLVGVVLARRRRRWLVPTVAGFTLAGLGVLSLWGLNHVADQMLVSAREPGVSGALEPIIQAGREGMIPDTVYVMIGGAVLMILGLLSAAIGARPGRRR